MEPWERRVVVVESDRGRNGFKFTADGRLLLVLGEAGVPGDDAQHFNMPTDVAVAEDGTFFVSDGYGNARVLKFAADGTLVLTWGSHGAGPGEFDLPHGIAIDKRGRVLVADRSNARVQVFDSSGKFLDQWRSEDLGRPYAAAAGAEDRVFIADGGDQPETPPDRSGVAVVMSSNYCSRFPQDDVCACPDRERSNQAPVSAACGAHQR
jgi:peptidylamidoglycolate lyase